MNISHSTLVRSVLLLLLAAAWWFAAPRGLAGVATGATFFTAVAWWGHARWRRVSGRQVVASHPFPAFLRHKLRTHYPALTDTQVSDVERGLRQFFIASLEAQGKFVAMPSKVVDALWHEFILHTRDYESFCRRAFGHLLHHTPAEAMPAGSREKGERFSGLRRAWVWSCREERIDPRKPDRLPLLFALDTMLAIPGGYRYVPDCTLLGRDRGDTHCAGGFGCGSSCGSSGCSSGDGGGGCGGGD